VSNLALAIRGASVLTLLVAVLVLGGALAAGHRHRVYEAVILKTVGATRIRLLSAYALEYLALGLATAIFGMAAGSAAAAFVIVRVMNLSFAWLPGPSLAAAAGAVAATVVFGLIGTFTALGQKPAPVLRNLETTFSKVRIRALAPARRSASGDRRHRGPPKTRAFLTALRRQHAAPGRHVAPPSHC
jgi:putative ABC transport system permease protein